MFTHASFLEETLETAGPRAPARLPGHVPVCCRVSDVGPVTFQEARRGSVVKPPERPAGDLLKENKAFLEGL